MRVLLIVYLLLSGYSAISQRVINDSPMAVTIRVYKPNAKTYSNYNYALVVGKGASVDLKPSRKGVQLQVWSSKDMTVTTQRVAAGKVYSNSDVIIISRDYAVTINPPRKQLEDSLPAGSLRHEMLLDGQGIVGNEFIEDVHGFRLLLHDGKLVVQNKSREACMTVVDEVIEYAIFNEGYLSFYKRNVAGGYMMIRQLGKYRPGSTLILNGCKVEVAKDGFVEWSIPEKLSLRKSN